MSSGARPGRIILLAVLLAALCTTLTSAQQTLNRRSEIRLLAQQELQLAQPREEVIQLPALKVLAPARLPESPLPLSSLPSAIQIVPGHEIPQSGTSNLQEYLTRLPGITLNDEQGNKAQPDLAIRGFQVTSVTGVPQGVSVFLDGVRINEPTVEEVNFDLLPLDDLERLEVIRGPSVLYGRNTLGAAVNIITRRGGPTLEVVPELSGGSFGFQKYRTHVGGAEGPVDYYLAGTYAREDGWRDASEVRIGKAFGKLGYRNRGTDATLSFQYVDNRIEQPGSLPLSELRRDRTRNFTGGDFFSPRLEFGTFNLRQELGSGLALAGNAFARHVAAEQFNVSLISDNTRGFTDTLSAGGTLQLSHRGTIAGRDNRLIAGVEYVYNDVTSKVFAEKNDRTLAECIEEAMATGADPAACPLVALSTDVADTQHAVGLFVQDTLEVAKGLLLSGDSIVVTAAGRWDWIRHHIRDNSPPSAEARPDVSGTFTFDRLNPRVGVNYNLSADNGFYFSYAQGFRAPAFLELTCASPGAICPGLQAGVAPDPPLKPVKATTYEVGVRARPLSWLETELSLYRTDVSNDIFSVSPTGTIGLFFQNVGDTRRQGLEFGVRGTLQRLVDAYVNYSYTEATFRGTFALATPRLTPGCEAPPCAEVVHKGNAFPLIPKHRVNAGIDYHPTSWLTLSLGATFVSTQFFRGDEANEEQPLASYVVLRAGLSTRWKKLAGYLWINNLLNTQYETFGTFAPNAKLPGAPIEPFLTPAPPINVMAGLRYQF
jgi:outer membrane receptor protein involved in Fe transport